MRRAPTTTGIGLMLGLIAASAGAQGPTPSLCPPSLEEAHQVVRELDRALSSGDRAAFDECFSPVHHRHHERSLERLAPLLRPGAGIERTSEVVRYWTRGELGVAVVRAETRARDQRTRQPVVENLALVLTVPTAERAAIRLCVELDAAWLPHVLPVDDTAGPIVIDCPACNYTLGVGDPWLAVPNCRQRSGCFESYTIFALDADLIATFSIHVSDEPAAPHGLLSALTVAEAGPRIDSTVSPMSDWAPSPVEAARDHQARGARCRVTDPEQGRATELYLLSVGRIGYLITVEGTEDTFASHRTAIDELLDGFRLVDPQLDPERLADAVLAGHVGGRVDGSTYFNDRFAVRLTGPDGWGAHCGVGQYAFDVSWDCPQQRGALRLKGLQPPTGTGRWTEDAADRTLAGALRGDGIRVRKDSGWAPPKDGAFRAMRSLELVNASEKPLLLRLALADDLLVILEGEPRVEAARAPLGDAMDSLFRDR